jgi:hypothetical protein
MKKIAVAAMTSSGVSCRGEVQASAGSKLRYLDLCGFFLSSGNRANDTPIEDLVQFRSLPKATYRIKLQRHIEKVRQTRPARHEKLKALLI